MVKWFHYRYYDENLNEIKKNCELNDFDDSFFVDIRLLFMHGLQYSKIITSYDTDLMLFTLENIKTTIVDAAKTIDMFTLLESATRPWSNCGTLEDEIFQMTKILSAALRYNMTGCTNEDNPKVCYITFYMV